MTSNKLPLVILSLSAMLAAASSQAAVINFRDKGNWNLPEYRLPGVNVTGSANVQVLHYNGLGIAGGPAGSFLDYGETITFTFRSGSETDVSYEAGHLYNSDLSTHPAIVADRLIEVFGVGGDSLGVFNQAPEASIYFDVSGFVGNQPISGFSITMLHDSTRISGLTFSEAPVSEVPVPAAAWLFGSALLGLFGVKRKS